MNYAQMIQKAEKKAALENMEVSAIKWLFFYSDFAVPYHHLSDEVSDEIYQSFMKIVDLYVLLKKPPQYIVHRTCFFGYDFYVDENVFIPRPETEQLVEETILRIDQFFANQSIVLADVCCGSGVIGLTIKKEVFPSQVYLCDINPKAIEIVQQNAKKLDVQVFPLLGDFITPLLEKKLKFDVLVCNPPYIKNQEKLDDMVYNNEPHNALFGGDDGLDFYRILFDNAKDLLKERPMMAFEFGYDQKEALESLIQEKLFDFQYEFLKDYAGLYRMVFLFKNLF